MKSGYFTQAVHLTAIADAIRQKAGTSSSLTFPYGFISAIQSIQNANPVLQNGSMTPSDSLQTLIPDTGNDGYASVFIQAIPSDYVGSGVQRLSASAYTPGSISMMISGGVYLSESQTILGDVNLVPENIVEGVSIFGIVGTLHSGITETFSPSLPFIVNEYSKSSCYITGISKVAPYRFYSNSYIETVNLPDCLEIRISAFYGCDNLRTVTLLNVLSIYSNAFRGCSQLETVYLSNCIFLSETAFNYCSALSNLYLFGSSIPQIDIVSGYGALSGTPIASSSGSIFVPLSMLEDYKVASQWSRYSSRFVAIEQT